MAQLVLVRHGESEWNKKGLWTGWTDVPLTDHGHDQAREAGRQIKDIQFSHAFTSTLIRAQQTLENIKEEVGQSTLSTSIAQPLIERNYGSLTGKNKWDIQKEYGDEQFLLWRRGWNTPPPEGESLKDVYERVIPYYQQTIEPKIKNGENIIIVAHGNSLRALIKYLENINDEDISTVELATGEAYVYDIDPQGSVITKTVRKSDVHDKHHDIH